MGQAHACGRKLGSAMQGQRAEHQRQQLHSHGGCSATELPCPDRVLAKYRAPATARGGGGATWRQMHASGSGARRRAAASPAAQGPKADGHGAALNNSQSSLLFEHEHIDRQSGGQEQQQGPQRESRRLHARSASTDDPDGEHCDDAFLWRGKGLCRPSGTQGANAARYPERRCLQTSEHDMFVCSMRFWRRLRDRRLSC